MKHLGTYLKEKYGTSNIFEVPCSLKEYCELCGWAEAMEEYERNKTTLAVGRLFTKEEE